jgi:hypothetical protein
MRSSIVLRTSSPRPLRSPGVPPASFRVAYGNYEPAPADPPIQTAPSPRGDGFDGSDDWPVDDDDPFVREADDGLIGRMDN